MIKNRDARKHARTVGERKIAQRRINKLGEDTRHVAKTEARTHAPKKRIRNRRRAKQMCHSVFGMAHAHQAASCHYVIVLRQVSLHCMQVGAVFCSEVKPGCRVRPVNKMDLRVEFFPRFWGDWRCVAFVCVLCSCERELCVCVATLNMLPCCRVDDWCSHHHVDCFEQRANVCFSWARLQQTSLRTAPCCQYPLVAQA